MPVADQVRELQTHLADLRVASAFLLDQDSWDRFGRRHASEHEIAERTARERQMVALQAASIAALEALVSKVERAALVAWADAHVALLDHFMATTVTLAGPNAVAVGVARQEREAWQAVKRGEQRYVDGNSFFITYDRTRYRELFGLEP